MAPALDLGEYAWYSMVNALAHNRDAFDKNYFLTRNANLVRPCGDVRHGISDINVQDSRFHIIAFDTDATWCVHDLMMPSRLACHVQGQLLLRPLPGTPTSAA